MAFARPAVPGFSPLDDELGLLPGNLTPRLQEALVRLSTQQPSFAKAATELAFFTGATIHADTARRRTEAAGAVLVAHETTAAARILHTHPAPPPGPDTLVCSVDGAMVPIGGGQWMEVRTLAVGEVQPPRMTPEGPRIQTTNRSYFSRLTDSTTFADLAVLELHRRGIETARRVGALVDGAAWCQSFIDSQYGDAVRMLDLPHAAEHSTLFGQIATPDGPLISSTACAQLRHALKHDGPAGVLAERRALVAAHPDLPEAAKPLASLEKRQAQLDYPQFAAAGWPVGSGMVERANKLVVEDRLKGAGMHGVAANVNPMLALRNAVCNDRWAETWPVIEREQRRPVLVQRQARRARHHPAAAREPAAPPATARAAGMVPATSAPVCVSKPPHPWTRAWSIRRQRELANAA